MSLRAAKEVARKRKVPNWDSLAKSRAKGKRFAIRAPNGRLVNFGAEGGSTFLDHHDPKIRKAWQARHREIRLKDGRKAYKVVGQPAYYSWNILW